MRIQTSMDAGERDPSHLSPLGSQIRADFSYPFSVPSQPPDVRNWFSSYEYESPESSDLPYVGSLKSPENDDGETQDPLGILGIEDREEPSSPKKCDDGDKGCICTTTAGDSDGDREKLVKKPMAMLKRKVNLRQLLELVKETDGEDHAGSGDIAKLETKDANFCKDPDGMLEKPAARLKRKQNLPQVLEERNMMKHVGKEKLGEPHVNGNITKPKTHDVMLHDKQSFAERNDGGFEAYASVDGFVSRKKRDDTAGRERLASEESKENGGVLAGKKQSQAARSGAKLVDRTNVYHAEVEHGIPGKWQCPRKSKPYIGPPMKQLRLERWVRREN